MNGTLYISFFQGQLESAFEQVVQLAVQEITKTVGATLNSMLLETTAKDQENQRLRLKLQSSESECNKGHGKTASCKGGRETNVASEETKPEQHTPSPNRERCMQADTLRIEQRGRAVGQLKVVMEQVLEFAVSELTKIVEDSFDDLLLELTKVDHENEVLNSRLRGSKQCQGAKSGNSDKSGTTTDVKHGVATMKKEPDNDSDSPGSSEGTRQDPPRSRERAAKVTRAKQQTSNESTNAETDKQKVLAVAQDWVPILDKVFGQKWCSEAWHIKEAVKAEGDTELTLSPLGTGQMSQMDALIRETLEPTCPAGQRAPDTGESQWLQPEDLEVLSSPSEHQGVLAVSPTGGVPDLSSPSMLHRLLTLPSQLLEGDEESMEVLPVLSEAPADDPTEPGQADASPGQIAPPILTVEEKAVVKEEVGEEEEDEEEEEEDDDKSSDTDHCFSPRGSSRGSSRKSHACKRCGKRFSRAHLLKAHQQVHESGSAPRCPECGKRFTHPSRLQAHLRTHTRGRRDPQE